MVNISYLTKNPAPRPTAEFHSFGIDPPTERLNGVEDQANPGQMTLEITNPPSLTNSRLSYSDSWGSRDPAKCFGIHPRS